jgi:hypothetical protein
VNAPGLFLLAVGWVVGATGAVVAEVNGSDPLSQLTGYGALGLVVLGAVIGQIRFKPEVSALREDMAAQAKSHAVERERMQSQIDTLIDVHRTQVLPALLNSAEALRTSAEQVQRMSAQIAMLVETLRERR